MKYSYQRFSVFYKKRQKVGLLRPLLVFNRFQISKLCNFCRLPIYIDYTNQLTSFRRNRLRLQIWPILRTFFNPNIDLALERFLSVIHAENEYFLNHLKNIQKFINLKNFDLKKDLRLKWICFLPDALQRKFYQKLLISHFRSLTFNEVEFLLRTNIFRFK